MKETENMAYRAVVDWQRKFGIELEGYGLSSLEVAEQLENVGVLAAYGETYSKSLERWTVGRDSTIQQLSPIELISPPLTLKELKQVEAVSWTMTQVGLKTDNSCGLHIHWNVSDYSGRSLVNLLRLYAKYEKVLDLLFHPSRREDRNQHCRSLIKGKSLDWIYRLNKPFYYRAYQIAKEFETTQHLSPVTSEPSARHHKINICAVNKYGTVEFRQHHGSLDFEEIKHWILFSQQLVLRAKDATIGEGAATWDSLIKTLGLSEKQLEESIDLPEKDCLRETRDFYRERYKRNAH